MITIDLSKGFESRLELLNFLEHYYGEIKFQTIAFTGYSRETKEAMRNAIKFIHYDNTGEVDGEPDIIFE